MNFRAAADSLKIPRSTVSQKIAALEQDLGLQLLRRTTRRVELTEDGKTFFAIAQTILLKLESTQAELSEKHSSLTGKIRLTTVEEIGTQILPTLIAKFLAENPGVEIELDLDHRVRDLITDGFDLAIRAGQLEDSSLRSIRLGTSTLQLFAAPEYLNQNQSIRTIDDLRTLDCYSFLPSKELQLTRARQMTKILVSKKLQVSNLMVVKSCVMAGIGIGLLPSLFCQKEVLNGRLIPVLPEWSMKDTPFHLVYSTARSRPTRVRVFIQFLRDHLSGALS